MECSLPAFFASSIAVSVLVIFLYFMLKKNQVMSKFGVVCFYLSVLLVLVRGYLPLDFCGTIFEDANGLLEESPHLTRTVCCTKMLPVLTGFLRRPLFSVGGVSVTLNRIFLAIWMIGAVVFLWKQISGYFSCKKEMVKLPMVEDAETIHIFHKVFQEIFPGKENRCTIVRSDLFGSAVVFGIRKPILVLPSAEYSSGELELVFQHELFHVKHKDYLWKSLYVFLAAVHWWNPVISRLFLKVMVQAQELMVDYCVTRGLKPQEKLCYLECIKKTAEHAAAGKTGKRSVYALGSGSRKRDVLQRFQLILAQNVKGYTWKSILIGLLFFVLSFTFVFEEAVYPEYDEYGNKVFNYIRAHSYFIKNGEEYDLYLNDEYFFTYEQENQIEDDFKDLPIYESDAAIAQDSLIKK